MADTIDELTKEYSIRNALVTHVSTQTRAGFGDLRARQSQEESAEEYE